MKSGLVRTGKLISVSRAAGRPGSKIETLIEAFSGRRALRRLLDLAADLGMAIGIGLIDRELDRLRIEFLHLETESPASIARERRGIDHQTRLGLAFEIGPRRAVEEPRGDIDRNRLARRDRRRRGGELDLEALRHEVLHLELHVSHGLALGIEVGVHLPTPMRGGLGQREVVALTAPTASSPSVARRYSTPSGRRAIKVRAEPGIASARRSRRSATMWTVSRGR